MEELTGGALLDALRGVHWPARRVSRGALSGSHRSRRVGASPEFMEYRPYQQGDDPSRIDWKLFGRTERVAVRLSHDDSSLRTMLLLDASASMAFPADTRDKWRIAAAVTLGLAAVAHRDGDPVGCVLGGAEPVWLPPRSRRGTVAALLRQLVAQEPAGTTPLTPLLARIQSARRVVIVSDFLGDAEALLAVAREMVAGGVEIFAIHIVAREELDPEPPGAIVVDSEREGLRRPLGREDLPGYRERFAAWRAALAESWRAAGAVYQEAVTTEPPDRIVRRVVGPGEPVRTPR